MCHNYEEKSGVVQALGSIFLILTFNPEFSFINWVDSLWLDDIGAFRNEDSPPSRFRSGNTQVFFNLTLSTTFHTWICLVLSGTCIGTYSCLYLDEKQSYLIGLCRL